MNIIKKLFHLFSKEKEKDDVEKLRGKLDTFLKSTNIVKKELKKSIKKTKDEITKIIKNDRFIKLLEEYSERIRESEEEIKPIIINEQYHNDVNYVLELSRYSFVSIKNKNYNFYISILHSKFLINMCQDDEHSKNTIYSYEDLNLTDFKLEDLIVIEEKLKELLHLLKDGGIFEEMNKKLLEIIE